MKKKLHDIKAVESNKTIFIGAPKEKQKPSKPPKQFFKKAKSVQKITDIKAEKADSFQYVKGKRFYPPKFLGNLLKIGFIGFLIVFVANTINVYYIGKNIEKDVSSKAYEGYNFLIDAGKNATEIQFEKAKQEFASALENFSIAEKTLWFYDSNKTFYSKGGEINKAVDNILKSGQHFALAGGYFLEAIENFNRIPIYFVNNNSIRRLKEFIVVDPLKEGLRKTNMALDEIANASEKIDNINEKILPKDIREKISMAKHNIEDINSILKSTATHFPAIEKLLGERYPHRYLIIFQNNNEIRPTGGFIGSYAIMDINDGYIGKLETHDVYELDGSYGEYIEPPEEYKVFTSNWRFRDSNYSPDFPTSAKKMMWFLQKQGGPGVDTVIAINQGLLSDMLEITGPVQVGAFGKLNSENYNLLLSYVIEGKIWGAEDPKHILKVFVPAFKDAILKEQNIAKVSSKLYKAVQQKHIMVYSADEDIQNFIEVLGLDGSMRKSQTGEDYLSVINISMGISKSEQFIEETILHESHINIDGYIENTVTVSRKHAWNNATYDRWKEILNSYGFNEIPEYLIDILGRGKNKVLTRIYVPAGSKMTWSNKENIEIKYDQDTGKTYFLSSMELLAGESDEWMIKYQLPFRIKLTNPAGTYRLFVEKQPGSRGSVFTKTLTTDEKIYNLAVYPEDKIRLDSKNRIIYATDLVYDKFFAGVWTK